MRYVLLVYSRETSDALASAAQDQARFQAHAGVGATSPAIQAMVMLYSSMTATTLRLQAGRQILEDSPVRATLRPTHKPTGARWLVCTPCP
jgi:hypothetical protein